jgi:uncharacterized LabA/DUF88 family protein
MNRAAIFIDGATYYAQKTLGWDIDWGKLLSFFGENYKVIRLR